MPYEDYRYDMGGRAGNFQTQGRPQAFYSPSTSFWGNVRERTAQSDLMGDPLGSAGVGSPKWARFLQYEPGHALAGSLQNAFTDKGNVLKNLGSGRAWKNVATFGQSGASDAKAKAKRKRINAVQSWRAKEGSRLGDVLNQSGTDVATDLQPELQKALGAGGKMGDMGKTRDALTSFQDRYNRYILGRTRAGQAREVDAMFADPQRLAGQQQRIAAEKQLGQRNIAESYRIGSRNNAFNQARRGTQGGSTDIEQQGDLTRGRDAAGLGLQSGLDARSRQYRLNDQKQRSALMGLIYADDPDTAGAFSRTLEGIDQAGQQEQEQRAIEAQRQQQMQASSAGFSQILGNTLSSGSDAFGRYLDERGGGA